MGSKCVFEYGFTKIAHNFCLDKNCIGLVSRCNTKDTEKISFETKITLVNENNKLNSDEK